MKGTVTDTGPLYALVNRDDDYNAAAVRGANEIALPMLTTWVCLAEAMHFLRRDIGWRGQRLLLDLIERSDVVVLESDYHPVSAVSALMERYADTPMDLADASLVAAAVELDKRDVFTFDQHFRAYAGPRRRAFRLLPTA